MKLLLSKQVSVQNIDLDSVDIIFLSSGYEERARYFATTCKLPREKTFVLSFLDAKTLNRTDNDILFFTKCGFNRIELSGEDDGLIVEILVNEVLNKEKAVFNILIDYSSMTRVWFAAFLSFFRTNNPKFIKKINLYFLYSHAKYVKPPNVNFVNMFIGPIKGFCNISLPDKPSALIIGLGYEKNKAFGLSQYLDAESFIFYSDKGYEPRFSEAIENVNSELINSIKPENIFKYPILDLNISAKILNSLIQDILNKYRVVLAPCGPKPFTLLCLLESLKNEEVDVWRISAGNNGQEIDRIADGTISVLNVMFENETDLGI